MVAQTLLGVSFRRAITSGPFVRHTHRYVRRGSPPWAPLRGRLRESPRRFDCEPKRLHQYLAHSAAPVKALDLSHAIRITIRYDDSRPTFESSPPASVPQAYQSVEEVVRRETEGFAPRSRSTEIGPKNPSQQGRTLSTDCWHAGLMPWWTDAPGGGKAFPCLRRPET